MMRHSLLEMTNDAECDREGGLITRDRDNCTHMFGTVVSVSAPIEQQAWLVSNNH